MAVSLDRVASFMATHARVLDRRRFDLLTDRADPTATRTALNAYRNHDGGYGNGLEPDLRAPESQPAGALHAFEVFGEIGDEATSEAVKLCDWLDETTLEGGGLPFAVAVSDPSGCAPFWADADPSTASLHITAAVAGSALRAARAVPDIAAHPWLEGCIEYCLVTIAARAAPEHALELRYCLTFLDLLAENDARAAGELERLGAFIPPSGELHVGGGLEDEMLRPLDFAPEPGRPIRELFSPEKIEGDLARVEGRQAEDGGWPLAWQAYSPAAALEWRGYVTVDALKVLKANGRL